MFCMSVDAWTHFALGDGIFWLNRGWCEFFMCEWGEIYRVKK